MLIPFLLIIGCFVHSVFSADTEPASNNKFYATHSLVRQCIDRIQEHIDSGNAQEYWVQDVKNSLSDDLLNIAGSALKLHWHLLKSKYPNAMHAEIVYKLPRHERLENHDIVLHDERYTPVLLSDGNIMIQAFHRDPAYGDSPLVCITPHGKNKLNIQAHFLNNTRMLRPIHYDNEFLVSTGSSDEFAPTICKYPDKIKRGMPVGYTMLNSAAIIAHAEARIPVAISPHHKDCIFKITDNGLQKIVPDVDYKHIYRIAAAHDIIAIAAASILYAMINVPNRPAFYNDNVVKTFQHTDEDFKPLEQLEVPEKINRIDTTAAGNLAIECEGMPRTLQIRPINGLNILYAETIAPKEPQFPSTIEQTTVHADLEIPLRIALFSQASASLCNKITVPDGTINVLCSSPAGLAIYRAHTLAGSIAAYAIRLEKQNRKKLEVQNRTIGNRLKKTAKNVLNFFVGSKD